MIPDFQTIMLPLLKWTSDQEEHSLAEAREYLGNYFNLNDNEKQELLPSGTQPIFTNRVARAKVYLNQAGLLESTKRGFFKITVDGLNTLKENIDKITINFLLKFSKFQEFKNKKIDKKDDNDIKINDEEIQINKTPEEQIEDGYKKLHDSLANDVLNKVKSCSPDFFETLVVNLLIKMGYGGNIKDAGKAIGKSGDEGIDGIIKEDKLGLDVIYLQAKRYQDISIGRPEIQKFVGALAGKKAKKGIFITTSSFSKQAEDFALGTEYRIILIDGDLLANLMIENNVGINTKTIYEIKQMDYDYFDE